MGLALARNGAPYGKHYGIGTLTANGKATGTGFLQPRDYKDNQYSTPIVNEEYIFSDDPDSTMELDLLNAENGLYVAHKNEAAQDIWWIQSNPNRTYSVTYHANGGTGTLPTTQKYIGGADVTVASQGNLTNGDKTLKGWNINADGTGTAYQPGDVFQMSTKNINLYAIWEIPVKTVTVTYSDSGAPNGAVVPANDTIDKGSTYTAKSLVAIPEGWLFRGWFTDQGMNTPFVDASVVEKDITLYGKWEKASYTVTFNPQGGNWEGNTANKVETVEYGQAVAEAKVPTKEGHTFEGWYTEADGGNKYDFATPVKNDVILYAHWKENSTGGGGSVVKKVILHYESNGGTVYKDEKYSKNTVVTLDKVPVRTGYQFTGWCSDEALTDKIEKIKMTTDKTVYAGWRKAVVPDMLNEDDHIAYVVGYTDGTVQPKGNIIRAEVASIFYRLLQEDIRNANTTDVNKFNDVNEGMWFNTTVSTMEKLNIVAGRGDGEFAPYANITRAEFAAICARFDTSISEGDSNFTDISGHWAEKDIERAVALGWISGYQDGTFRPNNFITRAEAMSMINRVLCRLPETEADLLDGMKIWPDNRPGVWYYLAVQEATNSHTYETKGEINEH